MLLKNMVAVMNDQNLSHLVNYEYCQLIDYLVQDMHHLETELVRTRLDLSQHLPPPYDDALRSDILSDLGGRYSEHPAYRRYLNLMHNGLDPLEDTTWVNAITDAAGIDRY